MTPNPIIATLLAVVCWSTSATVIGTLGQATTPFLLAAIVQAVGAMALAVFRFKDVFGIAKRAGSSLPNEAAGPVRALKFPYLGIAAFAALLFSYHALFYTAMMSEARLQANIANYLWPILLTIANFFVFKNTRASPSIIDYCVLGLGFLGCASLVGDVGSFSEGGPHLIGFGAGLLAALAAALYMGQSARLVRINQMPSSRIWFVGLILAAPVSLTVAFSVGELRAPLPPLLIPVAVWLGVVTVAVAQVSWTWAVSRSRSVLPNILVYLTPILSTLLQIWLLGDEASPSFLFGLVFIVFASLITTRAFNSFFSELGAAIVFLYSAFVLFYRDWLSNELLGFGTATIPIELFGILAGFFLARQWQRSREEEIALASWGEQLRQICRHFNAPPIAPLREPLKQYVRELIKCAVQLDQATSRTEFVQRYSLYQVKYDGFDEFIAKYGDRLEAPAAAELNSLRRSAHMEAAKWVALKGDRTTAGDLVVVGLLGIGLIIANLRGAIGQASIGIAELLIPPIVAYIGFRIVEYNIRPGMSSISSIVQVQKALRELSAPYYIGDYRQIRFNREIRLLEADIDFEDDSGSHRVHSSDLKSRLMGLLVARNWALAFLIAVPLVVGGLLWVGGTNGS